MLLTISTTHRPATDLGYLLHKHPDRVQTFGLTFGEAHVFYPAASEEICTAVLAVDVDHLRLTRSRGSSSFSLYEYVNDRPYSASSFLSVAMAEVFSTALAGRCDHRQELVGTPIPLTATLPTIACSAGADVIRELFEPLGYTVTITQHELDAAFPEWGAGRHYAVELQGCVLLRDLLSHIYVLMPVIDNDKHYGVGSDEVEKLLRHGRGWLKQHPKQEMIMQRYLRYRRSLMGEARTLLTADDAVDPDERAAGNDAEEVQAERTIGLNEQRMDAVFEVLKSSGATRVIDLGCGEGRLLKRLLDEPQFKQITGVDVTWHTLTVATRRLRLATMPERQRERIELLHGSLLYRDERLRGFDAAAVVEVIEHLEPFRLEAFERVIFGDARPRTVALTTPNAEYNVRWPSLPAVHFRHRDHRFEWTRAEFRAWCEAVAARNGYAVRYVPIGDDDPEVGPPTQMGVFTR